MYLLPPSFVLGVGVHPEKQEAISVLEEVAMLGRVPTRSLSWHPERDDDPQVPTVAAKPRMLKGAGAGCRLRPTWSGKGGCPLSGGSRPTACPLIST